MAISSKDRNLHSLPVPSGTVHYSLARSSKRRTLQITIKDSLEISVAAPRFLSQGQIESFIRQKSAWILRKLTERRSSRETRQNRNYTDGEQFLFLGKKYPIRILEQEVAKPSLVFDNQQWSLKVPSESSCSDRELKIKEQLTAWYRSQAKEILGTRLFHFVRLTGLEPRKIVIKTQKTLWGSCSSYTKSIQLNWKLVLAPLDVIDYVIVHELSHLAVPNHSQRFWQRVKSILPDYKQRQEWLKINRSDLALP